MIGSTSSPENEWFESRVEAFEHSWQRGERPDIGQFLGADSNQCENRIVLLQELIKVDLEYRWREGAGRGLTLEVYAKQFENLGSWDELPVELICEEYVVRHRFGDRPSHAEYLARFSRHGKQLIDALERIDEKLLLESAPTSQIEEMARPNRRAIVDPKAPLSYTDYQFRRQIGAGGICKVYTAIQKSLDIAVALKVLKKKHLHDNRCVSRFLNEAKIAARMRHAGIVRVHGIGRLPDDGYFMVMDLIDGEDLSKHCSKEAMSAIRAAEITRDLANAVQHIHDHGYIHCDLKPSNVLMDSAGRVTITDFGFAIPSKRDQKHESRDGAGGTLAYMAPEQVDFSFGTICPQTDIYGLGGILFTMLFGQPTAQNLGTSFEQISVGNLREDQAWLAEICGRCLYQSPAQRFSTAHELAETIDLQLAECKANLNGPSVKPD